MTLLPLERTQTATKALYLPVMGTFPFPWCPGGGLAFLTLWFESKPRTKAKEKSWSIEPALIFSFHCLFSLISISTSADVTATHQCTWSWGEREGLVWGLNWTLSWGFWQALWPQSSDRDQEPLATPQSRAGGARCAQESRAITRRADLRAVTDRLLRRTTATVCTNTWARLKGIFKYVLRWF